MKYARDTNNIRKRGFTLVELMVTISIAVLITAMLFANFRHFREVLSLKRAAQEIALSLRQAQVYGTSVREFGEGSGKFPGYGVRFKIASPDSYILFADVNANNSYDGDLEKVKTFSIGTNDRISDLCLNAKTSPPGNCSLSQLDVIFLRPNPTIILTNDGYTLFSDAEITITSPKGGQKTVTIWSTGQISVE